MHAESELDPDQYCAQLVARSGSSFAWAMRSLPMRQRRAMYAIYAFCRAVDDIADGDDGPAAKIEALRAWRSSIDEHNGGGTSDPIVRALSTAVTEYGLARTDLLAVIEGMEMDAALRVRIADDPHLALYCDRVAGAVGRLSNCVFGLAPPQSDQLAHVLGEALQITNILRDLDEDAARDRLYLPMTRLSAAGLTDTAAHATALLADPAIATVCGDLADLARRRFAEAAALISILDPARIRAPRLMMVVYQRKFDHLVARGWVRRPPVSLPLWEKAWLAIRYTWA
jgi:squalene synthase HpnD